MKKVVFQKAFTLVELLVVMGIMGLLGTISVGGYRAMTRGMEERGVMQSVNSFIRAAYQRAQIDRQPVVIYFWNETVRSSTDLQNEIVIGKAVAIRRYGRFSEVRQGCLIDEFADLNLTYPTQDEGGSGSSDTSIYIYPIERLDQIQSSSGLLRSIVKGRVKKTSATVQFLHKDSMGETLQNEQNPREVPSYGFELENAGGVTWKPGMAYGMEFLNIELPQNYLFGSKYNSTVENPIAECGTLVFDVGYYTGNGPMKGGIRGKKTIDICSLRPDGSGGLRAQTVATSDNPENRMD